MFGLIAPVSMTSASWRLLAPLSAVVLLLTGQSAPVQGGQLEAKLLEKAPEILEYMRSKKNCGNVGVLKGRVYKDGKYSDSVGALNYNFARRLEMALVLAYNVRKDKSLTILADATLTAARIKDASHLTATGIARLFDGRYKPRWGDQNEVKADGFVAGTLRFEDDMRSLVVKILAIGAGDERPEKVVEFKVDSDLDILLESGESFSLKGGLSKRRTLEEVVDDAHKEIKEQKKVEAPKLPVVLRPKEEQLVTLDIIYVHKGDVERVRGTNEAYDLSKQRHRIVAVRKNDQGLAQVDEPTKDECVYFRLKRVDARMGKVAVSIMVNGENLFNQDTRPPDLGKKWVLDDNYPTVLLTGYYYDKDPKNTYWQSVGVLNDEDSRLAAMNYGPESGQISMHVYVEDKEEKPREKSPGFEKDTRDAQRVVKEGFRKDTKPADTVADLKRELRPADDPLGIAAPMGKFDRKVEKVSFKNPVLVTSSTIVYYTPRP